MFFILLNGSSLSLIVMLLLVMALPLLFLTRIIPDILSALPKSIQKFLCFFPCIFLVAITIKLLFSEGMTLLFLVFMVPFFLLSLYGGFALIDILLSKNSR